MSKAKGTPPPSGVDVRVEVPLSTYKRFWRIAERNGVTVSAVVTALLVRGMQPAISPLSDGQLEQAFEAGASTCPEHQNDVTLYGLRAVQEAVITNHGGEK